MLFNSFEFIGFFVLVVTLYALIPTKAKWLVLLLATYFFYLSWNPVYIFLILGTTAVNYLINRQFLVKKEERSLKTGWWMSVIFNLGVLAYFKYYNFFIGELHGVWEWLHLKPEDLQISLALPLGISFYTFQTLSYTFDVYNGKIKAEKHLGKFALYVAFFPQLLSGPIEKARNLLPQLQELKPKWNQKQVLDGSTLFLFGLFKKVVVADNISSYLQPIFDANHIVSSGNWVMALYLYPVQLYADFSGYSDMARGLAKIMGIELTDNFNKPYFARSITDFWRRWHISLTSWLTEYLFTPLNIAFRNWGRTGLYLSILITFTLCGFWHEASWNYIAWGAVNACLLCLEHLNPLKIKQAGKIVRLVQILFTFHLICLSFVFLFTDNITQSLEVFASLTEVSFTELSALLSLLKSSNLLAGVLIFVLLELIFRKRNITALNESLLGWRYAVYMLLLFSIIFMGDESGSPFIYFRF